MLNPIPSEVITPEVSWIKYKEPESHLDGIVNELGPWLQSQKLLTAGCISHNDLSLLDRLEKKGIKVSWRLDLRDDLQATNDCVGLEYIQNKLTDPQTGKNLEKKAKVDLLVARHILDHAHRPQEFLEAIETLLSPQGVILVEVPDYKNNFKHSDYASIWEEHITYFTESSLQAFLKTSGWKVERFWNCPFPRENQLTALIRRSTQKNDASMNCLDELPMLKKFADEYPSRCRGARQYLVAIRESGKSICMIGAGHISTLFVHAYGVRDLIQGALDDDANKQGRYLSGTCIPILSTSELHERRDLVCLSSLGPESEQRFISKFQSVFHEGNELKSIFPGRVNSIPYV